MNVVMTEDGRIIEVQGTAEAEPFTHEELLEMLALAKGGIADIIALQKQSLSLIPGPVDASAQVALQCQRMPG